MEVFENVEGSLGTLSIKSNTVSSNNKIGNHSRLATAVPSQKKSAACCPFLPSSTGNALQPSNETVVEKSWKSARVEERMTET